MKKPILIIGVLCICFFLTGYGQSGPGEFKVLKTIRVEGTGGWDYLTADASTQRLFISHGTLVEVLDLKTDKVVGQIMNTPGVHGIALVPEFNKGFISAGKLDSVVVFDLKTLKTLDKIKTGMNPDAIIYDPYTKRVFTFNGRGNSITAIDAATNTVAGTIPVSGKPEFAVSDRKGKMYCNIEDRSTVVKFDPASLKVEAEWPMDPGGEPTGLAIDLKNNLLFSACSAAKQIIVMDASNGKVITTIPMGDGCDGIVFLPDERLIVASNGGDGTVTIVHQDKPTVYSVIQTLPTRKSARTITYDGTTGRIYLPSADVTMEEGKRKVTPGSFGIIVVGK
jgi:YVTN family beta-propeller protein